MLLDASALAAIAACADGRPELFAWADAGAGLCRALRPAEATDLRLRTHRQFAAVLANLCAADADLAKRDGRLLGLGEAASFTTFFGRTTVGAWARATDAELVRLRSLPLKDKGVRAAYRRIFGEAWAIGHGVGLKTSCPMPPAPADGEDSSVMAALGPDEDLEAPPAPVAMPNPFRGSTRFAFTVPAAAGADVDLGVFDVAGRRMASLARGSFAAGSHVVAWDGRGLDGSRARAGMYFVRGRIGKAEVMTSVMKIE